MQRTENREQRTVVEVRAESAVIRQSARKVRLAAAAIRGASAPSEAISILAMVLNRAAEELIKIIIEETGKTKIISLVNTAQPKIISLLTTGQPVVIIIKRSKIFVQDQNEQYLGVLPDDVGKRLTKLIKGGNTYTACIKSATEHNVCVFVKETKRVSKYKNQPSFPQTADQDLGLSKTRTKIKNYKDLGEEDDDRVSFPEEES